MSAFSEIMSQQLAEELSNQYHLEEIEGGPEFESPCPSDLSEGMGDVSDEVDEDERMAREMQQTFDAEFAECLVKGEENSERVEEEEEEEEEEEDIVCDKWGAPRFVSNRDENGDIITKHNPVVCGMKNANKVGLFIDGAGDMDGTLIANPVYNSLRQKSIQKEKREKISVRRTIA